MSYRTQGSQIFPQIPQAPKTRLRQDFTAIQVDDPRHEQLEATLSREQRSPQRSRSPVHYNTVNPRLDELVTKQDQLLSHQIQVSQRQNEIAEHLKNQENALNQTLLKQILNNKDNMIANMAQLQATEWDEHTRDLLMQHIKYIVAIVQRLNVDIEGLESELRGRDIAVVGTNKAVNKLEVHHVTMLQDLRGRIVRCDTAIAKHTKDITMLMDEVRRLEILLHQTRERLVGDIHRLEAEVMSITGELERQSAEQRSELSHLRSEAFHKLNMLEDKQQSNAIEFQDALNNNKSNIDHHLEKLEVKFKAMIDKATAGWGDLMNQVDSHIEARFNQLEQKMTLDKGRLRELQQNIENQVIGTLQDTLAYHNAELTKAKMEFRNGFTEIQESLTNMKGVVEGRRKLMGNQMKREIGQVKKALYMEMPSQNSGTTIVYRNIDKSDKW